ncbi:uncharacterized protein M6B38_355660 [Iris pallida]|uniref:VOC domain-containing protein n=1 Tax=Iris pallida TaxID=29817 RepID=A0AAX6GNB9_IRIPA|nr:uncharacterized protein M6B38_355660 [Iris pallida]
MLDKKHGGALPLASLNHVSLLCRSLEKSVNFYTSVLGFFQVRRPGSFDFDGAWLFNYGIGIHLLQAEFPDDMPELKTEINPKDNHISFQCESMVAVEKKLKEMGIKYVQRRVEEEGVYVDQLFFHDPDGFMIEICNCDILPVIPLGVGDQQPIGTVCKSTTNLMMQQQHLPAAIHVEEPHISCA